MQRQVLSSFFLFLLLSTALRAGSRVDATAVEDSATTRIRLLVKKHSSASSSSTTTTSSSSSSSSSDEKSTTARTPTHAEAAAAAAAVPTGVTWRTERELVEVQAWGLDSIRVTFTNGRGPIDSGALGAVLAKPELEAPPSNRAGHVARHSPSAARYRESASASSSPLNALVDVKISPDGTSGNVTNGGIRAVVAPVAACCSGGGAAGLQAIGIVFVNASTGTEILREFYPLHGQPARVMHPMARGSGSLMSAAVSFAGYENERLFGLGQHQHGKLDQSGFVIDLDQFNTEVSIPFLLSSRGYGLLFNVPSTGRVELSAGSGSRTRWIADACRQVDYVVSVGATPFDVLARYAEITGHAPTFPSFASGFWQSKDRYKTQAEVLNVSSEFATRDLPLSVLVVDDDPAFSPHIGDWRLNPDDWPNPAAMYKQVASDTGAAVLVSAWPTVEPASDNYGPLFDVGGLASSETGGCSVAAQTAVGATIIDQFNPDSRQYFFDELRKNHLSQGAAFLWLDCDEGGGTGEDNPYPRADVVYSAGSQREVGPMYPFMHQRAVFEGWKAWNATAEPMVLSRSAWAGSQRWGAAVWSGDVLSTWDSLALQIPAGLNMAMSGIPWWTVDAGGFMCGGAGACDNNVDHPEFQELVVRWVQFAGFLPIMRLHGSRSCDDKHGFDTCPNEPWSYGETASAALSLAIHTRESIRPYVHATMKQASATGRPPMRPLFMDFPDDATAALVEDQFMFGDEFLVAPVLAYQQRWRRVYLPGVNASFNTGKVAEPSTQKSAASTMWQNFFNASEMFEGGQWINASAPLDHIPVFKLMSP